VLYNQVAQDTAPSITYDSATGIFTVEETGVLQVSWIQSVEQPAPQPLSLGLRLNGDSVGTFGATLQQGQLVGSVLVDVTEAPATLQLINTGTNAIIPGSATVTQGNLIILRS